MQDRSKVIGQQKAIALLKQGFGNAISNAKKGNIIFRGKDSSGENELYLVKPSQHRRSSKNTYDLYNTLIDFVPSWKNWPKRSKSVICTSTLGGAQPFGNIHFVFPKNGAKIGVCSNVDFWVSFPYLDKRLGTDGMEDFNDVLATVISYSLNIPGGEKFYDSKYCLQKLQEFFKLSKKRVIDAIESTSINNNLRKDIDKNFKGNWIKYFSDLIDPVANKFQLTTIESYSSQKYKDNELWTDADCVMLRGGSWDEAAMEALDDFLAKKQWADL